jgi:hypothetical protein
VAARDLYLLPSLDCFYDMRGHLNFSKTIGEDGVHAYITAQLCANLN